MGLHARICPNNTEDMLTLVYKRKLFLRDHIIEGKYP